MGTVVVLAVLIVIIYFCVRSIVRDKKAGKCSGGCSGCSGCGSCQPQNTSISNTTKKKRS